MRCQIVPVSNTNKSLKYCVPFVPPNEHINTYRNIFNLSEKRRTENVQLMSVDDS